MAGVEYISRIDCFWRWEGGGVKLIQKHTSFIFLNWHLYTAQLMWEPSQM